MKIFSKPTHFRFVKWSPLFASLSAVAAAASLFVLVVGTLYPTMPLAPRWGVDFAGGTALHLRVAQDITLADLRSSLAAASLPATSVQTFGAQGREFLVRLPEEAVPVSSPGASRPFPAGRRRSSRSSRSGRRSGPRCANRA
jgi:preprotein translocase subunit SecF